MSSDDYVVDENLEGNLSSVSEFAGLSSFLGDEDIDETLQYVIRLIARPTVPAHTVAPLIVKLQAYAFDFKMKAKYYMFIGKGEDEYLEAGKIVKGSRKNLYLSMSEELDKLVAALKFIAKSY